MARRKKKWPHTHERETWKGWGPPRCVEIDEHLCLIPLSHDYGDNHEKVALHRWGFIVCHDAADLDWRCEGACAVDPHAAEDDRPVWEMTGTLERGNMTLAPSILCTRDQFHGFIREGQWVPA